MACTHHLCSYICSSIISSNNIDMISSNKKNGNFSNSLNWFNLEMSQPSVT